MDIKKAIIEVLTEHTKATTHEIADKYLLQPRMKVLNCLVELALDGQVLAYNQAWYKPFSLIDELGNKVNKLEAEIDILYRENASLKNTIVGKLLEEGKRRE